MSRCVCVRLCDMQASDQVIWSATEPLAFGLGPHQVDPATRCLSVRAWTMGDVTLWAGAPVPLPVTGAQLLRLSRSALMDIVFEHFSKTRLQDFLTCVACLRSECGVVAPF